MPASTQIHLLNPFANAAGGSEWRALKLYDLLSPHAEVSLWTEDAPAENLTAQYPIRRISMEAGAFPKGGIIVFVGCFRPPGPWVRLAKADRTIALHNTVLPTPLIRMLLAISALGAPIEMVYASKWLRDSIGHPGPVQVSPIDLDTFAPPSARVGSDGSFSVGRLSRDSKVKHFTGDAWLYRGLARSGARVRLMGAMSLREHMAAEPGIELLPECAEPAHSFLQGLDCFYYRTSDRWVEPSGRVVMEAMATGLPVVAHRNGGYAEWITHGRDGFLFDTQQQAFELLAALRKDPALRAAIGKQARASMERTYSDEAMRELRDFYLSATAPA
ncbi:MAG: glycosyltransferase family 4 protein [Gammaproteobacteria bacterium]|nr:glycosyltransferase family 4 protein [Gammaproteobacteria bacterium]